MATLIRANGSSEEVQPAGQYWSLDELRQFVGGSIQMIQLPNGCELVMNEESKLLDLPANPRATLMGRSAGIAHDDFVAGDVLVVPPGELD